MATATFLKLQREKEQLLQLIQLTIENEKEFKSDVFNEQSESLTRKVETFTGAVSKDFDKLEKHEQEQVTQFVQQLADGVKQLGEIALKKELAKGEDFSALVGRARDLGRGADAFVKKGQLTPTQKVQEYIDNRSSDKREKFFFARFFRTGYSKTDKVKAAAALKSAMHGDKVDLTAHMGALKQGRLGTLVKNLAREKGVDVNKFLENPDKSTPSLR
jgi:hypothetical protein